MISIKIDAEEFGRKGLFGVDSIEETAAHSVVVSLINNQLLFLFNDNELNCNDSRKYFGCKVKTMRKHDTVLAKVDLVIDLGALKKSILADSSPNSKVSAFPIKVRF